MIEMMWADNSPLLNAFDSFLLSFRYPSTFSFRCSGGFSHAWEKLVTQSHSCFFGSSLALLML